MAWLALGVVIAGAGIASVNLNDSATGNSSPVAYVARPVNAPAPSSIAGLRDFDAAFVSLVEFVEPAVVHIRASGRSEGAIVAPGGQGSGVIMRPDGWIVTNDHVVAGYKEVTVVLSDGREFTGKVTRSGDNQNDIAVVKIDAKDLATVKFADSDKVRPGQYAIAVGSPFGLENTVTIGHISGLGRVNEVANRGYSDMIQTDAPINPGNSGGPLLNINGEVVGINTAIFSGTGGNVGIGFAIPSNQARMIAEKLIKDGKLVRGYLGLAPDNMKPIEKQRRGVEGAIVREVPSNGPAASAGVKPDDVIVRIGNQKVRGQIDLRNAMLNNPPGSTVELELVRGRNERKTVRVKVAEQPPRSARQSPGEFFDRDGFLEDFRRRFGEQPWPEPFAERKAPESEKSPGSSTTEPARLGVQVGPVDEQTRTQFSIPNSAKGAVVLSVETGSPAARLGIEPGEVIERLGDKTIATPDDLVNAMRSVRKGDRVAIRSTKYGTGVMSTRIQDVQF